MREHKRRTSGCFDELGHGERFAGTRDAEQHLVLLAFLEAGRELVDGGLLVSAGAVIDRKLKSHICSIDATEERPDAGGAARA